MAQETTLEGWTVGPPPQCDDGSLAIVELAPGVLVDGQDHYGNPIIVSRHSAKLKTTGAADRLSYDDVVRHINIAATAPEAELVNQLMRLHWALGERGDRGDDWNLARLLEERIHLGQQLEGDIERAEQLLARHVSAEDRRDGEQPMQQVILARHLVDRYGRRVLTDAGLPGRDGREGVGSPTEDAQGSVAAAIYASCGHLDNAQLDEIVTWLNLYRNR